MTPTTKSQFSPILFLISFFFILNSCFKDNFDYEVFTDSRDNKTYNSIEIGDQIWMAENLNYDAGEGSWFYDDDPANEEIYGRLYNWQTASEICPSGWHLPSDDEWTELADFLGVKAGGILKETGTDNWEDPNQGATDKFGFSALPGGGRDYIGTYSLLGEWGIYWSSTRLPANPQDAWTRMFSNSTSGMLPMGWPLRGGVSVRCVKD